MKYGTKVVTKMAKKITAATIRALGPDQINRYLKKEKLGFRIAKEGSNYYSYYANNAKNKIDLKKIDAFWHLATAIVEENRTLLKHDRLYTFWQILSRTPFRSDPVVEVGTYRGGSAKFIQRTIQYFDLACPMFAFDTFEGHVLVDEELDGVHTIGHFGDTSFEEVKSYIDAPDVQISKGDFLQTAKQIENIDNFAMVHLDVDVYPVTKFCLEFFEPRTKPGSVIIVDDYGKHKCLGLRKAVDEYIDNSRCFSMHYLLSGQALLTRIN